MPLFDLPPKADLWLPPKPAIIRAWKKEHRAFLPPVFLPGSAASRTFVATPTPQNSATTYTSTAAALGTPAGTSIVVVIVHGWSNGVAGRTLNTVTIDGVSATLVVNAKVDFSGSSCSFCAIATAQTANTSGNIVVTYSAGMIGCTIDVYRLNRLSSITAYATASVTTTTGANGTSVSTTINIPGSGILIEGVSSYSNAPSPVGATVDTTQTANTFGKSWGGSEELLAAQTGRTVSATFSSTTAALAAASWS